ncbi:uncharacterized protein C20orf96 homolog isoform X3 [Ailuropoda melanoleuca]|uniref:uncharacterized protein C20orf96 homolog isoform X3 n=1 Tax=Ailuropoda melanoleuca TaxID=9646 RepID=UPI00149456A0|nr:uncharacterized protein C20orf96 homolog isoform X3 [Ailuropoda melanoleuca]
MMEVLSRPISFQTQPVWDSLRNPQLPESGLHSKPTMLMTSQPRNRQEKHRGRLDSGKTQATIRLLKTLLRNRRTTLQELCSHEVFLTKLNGELIKAIQDMEDSAALKVRTMLQQQDILETVMDILEYLNEKKLQELKRELEEWEEKEESKMKYLAQQVERLNAKIEKTFKEVSFLSTYMDHEYPVKSVQIANLVRQLQQLKDSQQDELDDLSEMRTTVLQSLSTQIQKKKRKLLKALVVKSQQPPQEALLRKMQDSRDMLKCTDRFRDVSGHGRGRPLCEGAEGWACPRICGSQACPDLAFRRPSALGLASLLASAITVRCYSSEKEVSAGPSHAFLTSTTGDGPLAASPRVAYPPIILLSLPPPILAA